MQVAKQNGYNYCASCIASHLTVDQHEQLRQEEVQLHLVSTSSSIQPDTSVQSSMQTLLVDLGNHVTTKATLKPTVPTEKHIFSSSSGGEHVAPPDRNASSCSYEGDKVAPLSNTSSETHQRQYYGDPTLIRKSLSKLVEFPGNVEAVSRMLEHQTPCSVDSAGKDMFGVAAIHKFSSWNKVDLLQLLTPHLTSAELNAKGQC